MLYSVFLHWRQLWTERRLRHGKWLISSISYLQHILIHHPTVFYAVCWVFSKMQESGSGLLHLLLVTSLYTSTIKWCNTYEKHCWIICSTSPNQTIVSVQQFNHECFKKKFSWLLWSNLLRIFTLHLSHYTAPCCMYPFISPLFPVGFHPNCVSWNSATIYMDVSKDITK